MDAKTSGAALTLTFPSDRETVITRAFNAPRRLVFDAWTMPEHVRHWYGPRHLTLTVCEIDLRPGGAWRYVVQAPDGSEYGFSGEYREIAPPERPVYTEGFEAMPGADYLVTTTFDEQDGKTTLTSRLLYKSQEHRDGHLNSGMEPGMRETLERLDEHLVVMATAEREIIMTRIFNAPRELVFKAWTDPQHVDNWWGPTGFQNETCEMDVRPGGVWRYVMHGPDGVDYDNKIVYAEVVQPERLVYTHGSSVEDDPAAFHVTVTFDQQGDKTLLTMRPLFATAAQRDAIVAFGAVELGQQSLGRLAEYITAMDNSREKPS
jgi:uncharacterized protein YndB with AHSA1/START domain